jgi:NADH:ubiquinone oxidoreductase subunit 4 (subunit M)
VAFGNIKSFSIYYFEDLDEKEMNIFFFLIIILLAMGIFPFIILDGLTTPSVYLVEFAKMNLNREF